MLSEHRVILSVANDLHQLGKIVRYAQDDNLAFLLCPILRASVVYPPPK
jgi:hypothetical protein